ncbi:MAG TPA: NnrS family protein [Xanthobacteraceae bacterium]|nr:NnrS family protein [Xanthobacteraceae bacterium]
MSDNAVPSSMPPALERRLKYAGPALLSYGFRPFFLGGAIWSVLCIVLWVPQFMGELSLRTAFSPLDWHIHEMIYGYVAAVMAGFLLTAIPNWTGRLPITGAPLAALAALWLAGRLAVLASAYVGLVAAALVDVLFLTTLALVAAREIVAGRNWRNLRLLVLLGVLIAGNVVFHAEVYLAGRADYGARIGIAAVIMLISLVGGRIVPSFTRNWLARRDGGRLPAPFARFDVAAIAASALALVLWAALPQAIVTGLALIAAALMQGVRLARWAGERTLADRLVLVLHAGYAFVPIGFAFVGAAILDPAAVPASVGIHAWTAGAIGLMTLAVMTRASLGHTGQPLAAGIGTQAIYLLALCAAVLRMVAALLASTMLMEAAGAAWVAAFGGFVLLYGPTLYRERPVWAGRNG